MTTTPIQRFTFLMDKNVECNCSIVPDNVGKYCAYDDIMVILLHYRAALYKIMWQYGPEEPAHKIARKTIEEKP